VEQAKDKSAEGRGQPQEKMKILGQMGSTGGSSLVLLSSAEGRRGKGKVKRERVQKKL